MSTKKTTKKAMNASGRSQKKASFLPWAKPIPPVAVPKKWNVIPGLYAAGRTMPYAGELHQAFPSGRIAGENSVKEASNYYQNTY